MGIGDIDHMNIVAHTSPILRVIIDAVNLDRGLVARCPKYQRDQMRFGIMVFTNVTIGIGSRRIKIA